MAVRAKASFSLIVAVSGWGVAAHAQGTPSNGSDSADPMESASNVEASAPLSPSDQQLLQMSQAETIEIYDERPDKPFDRDTEVRLTGEQLAARGAVDLGTALALLPDVTVRDAGRGGFDVDIRGARKGAVAVLIDGVSVTDPYYGTFDVSSIPITDIVQIRVATTPQSPIDGPGGPGGVIEVHTRDAFGDQLEVIRLFGDTLPTLGITGTARVKLTRHLALRISMSEQFGKHLYDVPGNETIDRSGYSSTGAARLEYRDGELRVVGDAFVDDRHYLAPPAETTIADYLLIDREQTERASLKADDKIDDVQVEAQAWLYALHRISRYFSDPDLINVVETENLDSLRMGGMALVTKPFAKAGARVLGDIVQGFLSDPENRQRGICRQACEPDVGGAHEAGTQLRAGRKVAGPLRQRADDAGFERRRVQFGDRMAGGLTDGIERVTGNFERSGALRRRIGGQPGLDTGEREVRRGQFGADAVVQFHGPRDGRRLPEHGRVQRTVRGCGCADERFRARRGCLPRDALGGGHMRGDRYDNRRIHDSPAQDVCSRSKPGCASTA